MAFQKFKNFSISKLTILLLVVMVLYYQLHFQYWKDKNRIIAWDTISYYAYLPATFIYKDITLKFTDNYKGEHQFVFWPEKTPIGGKSIKTSMGLSIMYAPFFFLGHIAAHIFDYDTGGYSEPYKLFLQLGTIFYFMIGLIFLRKILLKFFKEIVVSISLIAVTLGTNLIYYATIEPTAVHVYCFCLFCLFIFLSIKWFESPNIKTSILLGLLCGLISLIRPTNILIVLFFILYDVKSVNDFKNRVLLFLSKYKLILLIAFCTILVWVPQILYWKTVSGQWFFFSYVGESFFFKNPHIIEGLFGFRKGWFIYTPVMILACIGIPMLYRHLKEVFLSTIVFFIINLYIILSWWAWWYGGCYGMRPLIDSYGLMAIPLSVFISYLFQSKKVFKVLGLTITLCFISLSIYNTVLYYYGGIHWDSMTKEAYFASFKAGKIPKEFDQLLLYPDYASAKEGIDKSLTYSEYYYNNAYDLFSRTNVICFDFENYDSSSKSIKSIDDQKVFIYAKSTSMDFSFDKEHSLKFKNLDTLNLVIPYLTESDIFKFSFWSKGNLKELKSVIVCKGDSTLLNQPFNQVTDSLNGWYHIQNELFIGGALKNRKIQMQLKYKGKDSLYLDLLKIEKTK